MNVVCNVIHQLPNGSNVPFPLERLEQLRREGTKTVLIEAEDDKDNDREHVSVDKLLGSEESHEEQPMTAHSSLKETNTPSNKEEDEKHQQYRKQVAAWRETGKQHSVSMSGTLTSSWDTGTQWVMLSYQWDLQKLALSVFGWLMEKGVCVWMDVMGGMHADINDAMA